MNIKRHNKEKEICDLFKDDLLSMNCLAPSSVRNVDDLNMENTSYDFMSSFKVKKLIENVFGKSKYSVAGKIKSAKLFAFDFKSEILICTVESVDIGARWYWVNSSVEGSRYGQPMLLSFDKEVINFWPDFCIELKNMVYDN